jgi:hypothetical protein
MPTRQTPGYAGLPLKLEVVKVDQYGQTIAADSSSSLQVYSAVAGTKVNDNTVAFLGSIFSGFRGGRAVFSVCVKPSFASISVRDQRTKLQREPFLYVKGIDITTGAVMETAPQQVHLASGNRTACPVGSVLELEPSVGSETVVTDPRPGTCKVCDSGFYNVNPLTGRCLACPPSAMCIDGAPPLFGAQKVAGAVEMKLPDDGDDGVRQALADKLGVKAYQLTVLPQQPRRHSNRVAMRGAGPTTRATAQTQRMVTVSFELVADATQMAKLAVSQTALGVKLGEIQSMGPQAAAGEVWEEVDGSFLLRSCPPGHQLLNATADGSLDLDTQLCRQCRPTTYIIKQMFPCQKCPKGATCPDGVAFVSNAAGSEWADEPSADGGLQKRILRCPAGERGREQEQERKSVVWSTANTECVYSYASAYLSTRARTHTFSLPPLLLARSLPLAHNDTYEHTCIMHSHALKHTQATR